MSMENEGFRGFDGRRVDTRRGYQLAREFNALIQEIEEDVALEGAQQEDFQDDSQGFQGVQEDNAEVNLNTANIMAASQPPGLFGAFSPFDPKQESVDDLFMRYDEFCELNEHLLGEVAPGPTRKKLLFLNSLPVNIKTTLTKLCQPDLPKDKTFNELQTLLTRHYKPAALTFFEERKFAQLVQMPSETLSDFILKLQADARKCGFQNATLRQKLKDQLLFGARLEKVRDRLYTSRTNDDETFEAFCVNALQIEEEESCKRQMSEDRSATVNKLVSSRGRYKNQLIGLASTSNRGQGFNSRGHSKVQGSLQNSGAVSEVMQRNRFTRGKSQGPRRYGRDAVDRQSSRCSSCGGNGCDRQNCWAKRVSCYSCGRRGHITYACPSRRVHSLQDEDQEDDYQDDNAEQDDPNERQLMIREEQEVTNSVTVQAIDNLPQQVTDCVYINKLSVASLDVPSINSYQDYDQLVEEYVQGLDDEIKGLLENGILEGDVMLKDFGTDNRAYDMVNISGYSKFAGDSQQEDPGKSTSGDPEEPKSSEQDENELYSGINGAVDLTVANIKTSNIVNAVTRASEPLIVNVLISERKISMEIDSGSGVSLMNVMLFQDLFPTNTIFSTGLSLKTVEGSALKVVGTAEVSVRDPQGKSHLLSLVLCETCTQFTPLLGRSWLDVLVPEWRCMWAQENESIGALEFSTIDSAICVTKQEIPEPIQTFLQRFPAVFSDDRSQAIKGFKAKIVIKKDPQFMNHKEYELPYCIRSQVTNLIRLEVQEGRWIPVTAAPVSSPLWPVPKSNGSLRLCVDYKRTLNQNLVIDYYPLPKPDDVFHSMQGCSIFSVVDLSEAYTQIEVDPQSQPYMTISTHLGYFMPVRLMYGIASAPAIFQSFMDQLIQGLPNVKAYLDDVLIGAKDLPTMLRTLGLLFSRFNERNVRVNLSKCQFLLSEVPYLGHIISKDGLKVNPKRVEAILKAREPQNVSEVRAFLGMVNFYRKFLKNCSDILKPLNNLLQVHESWLWSPECQNAFNTVKTLLTQDQVLMLYTPQLPLVLMSDASAYGVGCVLSHRVNGVDHPISFASYTLSPAQAKYSQLEKEALAIITGVTVFAKYLSGREFILITDNLPLKYILSPDKDLPVMAAARIQRWAIKLSAFKYVTEFRSSTQMGPADMLSRLPSDNPIIEAVNFINVNLENLPINHSVIAIETSKCPVLTQVSNLVHQGWPLHIADDDPVAPYFKLRLGLSLEGGCLLYGDKVIIPPSLQGKVLKLLHEGHPGLSRMKLRARMHVYWPGIDGAITKFVQKCDPCSQVNFRPASNQTFPWPKTSNNWERLHLDFFYFKTVVFLILVDVHTKWLSVWPVSGTTASAVIDKLREEFAIFGLPIQIVTDNGPPFDSVDFLDFCTANQIIATKSPPYHPQANGSAERGVQTTKAGLRKLLLENVSVPLAVKLVNFLFHYRTTPCSVTRVSPAQLMFRHVPRTLITTLAPPIRESSAPRVPVFLPGERVKVRLEKKDQPTMGTIIKPLSTAVYIVNLNGSPVLCHLNQMKLDLSQPLEQMSSKECVRLFNPNGNLQYPPEINTSRTDKHNSSLSPTGDIADTKDCATMSGSSKTRCSIRSNKGKPPLRLDL